MRRLLLPLVLLAFCTCLSAQEFASQPVPEAVLTRMTGVSYPEGCEVPVDSLRYLTVTYYDFSGHAQKGEMVCNAAIAEDLIDIFKALYEAKYQFKKIALIDEYGGSDEASMEDDNTSCFNYRKITGSTKLSKHALGLAVDINPLENPYVRGPHVEPATAAAYVDRTRSFNHKIDETDLCYKLFVSHGFKWGGSWKSLKDYQHFEK